MLVLYHVRLAQISGRIGDVFRPLMLSRCLEESNLTRFYVHIPRNDRSSNAKVNQSTCVVAPLTGFEFYLPPKPPHAALFQNVSRRHWATRPRRGRWNSVTSFLGRRNVSHPRKFRCNDGAGPGPPLPPPLPHGWEGFHPIPSRAQPPLPSHEGDPHAERTW